MAASVVLQLPAERQPAEPGWDTLSILSELLGSASLQQAVDEQLQPLRNTAAVLRAPVQLLLRAPAPADGQATLENICLRCRLCILVQLALLSQPAGQLGAQAAHQQLWSMLPVLRPLLHQAVQHAGSQDAAVQDAGMHVLRNLCTVWQEVVCWLSSWCDTQQLRKGSAAIQPKRIAAAAGALRALPVLLVAAQLLLQQRQRQLTLGDLEEQEAAATLAGEILRLCYEAARLLVDTSREECESLSADSVAAAWQLHTTTCRAVHWLVADPSRRQLLPCLQQPAELCVTMSACLETAHRLCNGSEADLPASRRLHAMGVAQAAALHTLLACAGVHIDGGTALEGLSMAYAACPPAMTLQPGVGDSFLACLGRLPEVGARWLLRSLQAVCAR